MRLAGRPLQSARRAARGLAGLGVNYGGLRGRILRTFLFHAIARVTPIVAVEIHGLRVLVETADLGPGRIMFTRGALEGDVLGTALRAAQLSPARVSGGVFVDVGANVGAASVLALGRYGFKAAVAVEPNPRNTALLQANLLVNGLEDRCKLVAAAAGDFARDAELELSPDNFGDHRIRVPRAGPGEFREERRATASVPMQTVDAILAGEGVRPHDVALLWVDVQGFEAQVLEGASTLLEEPVPVVIEFWPYALRRAGGLEALCGLLERHFDAFIDLRRAREGGFRPEPVERLRTFVPAGEGRGDATGVTDLLFVNAPR